MSNEILILDDDRANREKLRDLFEKSNYKVSVTSSAAYAIAKIVQGNDPIVLIGEKFEEDIQASMVVALMRKCNANLKIIIISDESSLDAIIKLRKDGIFYHSLKPQNEEDNEEIRQAVECALSY